MSGHVHEHDHDHDHSDSGSAARRALTWALVLNGGFLFIEGGTGLITGSLALMSDAVHMLSDVGALAIALGAAQLARRAVSASQTFGMRRAEVLGAFVNSFTLLGACAYIVWEAVNRLNAGPPVVPGWPILIIGAIGLAINLGSAYALYQSDSDDLNIRAALLHMMADALGSVGAIAAAALVLAGYPEADPIVSLFIAALVLWGTWGLLRDSTHILMQFPPAGFDVEHMTRSLGELEGVHALHDVHVWTLDGNMPIMTAHLVAAPGQEVDALCRRALAMLAADFSVNHSTLQVESSETPCEHRDCSAAKPNLKAGGHHGHAHA